MSTIVCLSTKEEKLVGYSKFKIFDVVDGQQRLTTLIILLKTISHSLDSNINKKEVEQLEELLVKPNKQLILLQTNHDDSAYIFSNFLKTGRIPTTNEVRTWADKNLRDAFLDCKKYVDTWQSNNNVLELLIIVMNRLGFIFYQIEDESSVYTVFEVLNSRGMAVDWLDKCKSVIMGIAFEKLPNNEKEYHIDRLHQIWSSIYREIGLKNISGQEILRFSATLRKGVADNKNKDFLKKTLSADDALEYFRDYCIDDPTEVIGISEWLLEITKVLRDLYSNPRLTAVSDIIHARLLAVALLLLPHNAVSELEKSKLLSQWERITFRIFGLFNKDARNKSGDYTKLACRIVKDFAKLNKTSTAEDIMLLLQNLGKEYPIKEAVKAIKGEDCYNDWEKDLIYFMYRYEEYLIQKAGLTLDETIWIEIWRKSPQKSIEHIWPQEYIATQWDTVGTGKQEIEKIINSLGNLCILPPKDNTKAGNKSFSTKKQLVYKDNQLLLVKEISNTPSWGIVEIKSREENLLKWAIEAWDDIDIN